jgi:octaprenyl-diphosphate synthase
MLTIDSIYEPIRPEMAQVEEKLNQVTRDAPAGLAEQLSYVLKNGGKRLRPALTLLAGKFYNYNVDLLLPAAAGTELLHTATLVHDDTVDASDLRRGKLSVNQLWGNANAVLLGDYLFAASARMTAETGNIRVIRLFAQTLMNICTGEIQESLNPFNRSRERYFQAIGNKTASLLSTATESGAVLSDAPETAVQSLKTYGYNLGIAFQIVDDILDLTGKRETLGKPVASDLARGVFTLPAILILECGDSDVVKDVLSKDPKRSTEFLTEMVRNSSAIEESYVIAHSFCSRACSALEQLPRNSVYDCLTALVNYVAQRQS